MKLSRAMKKGTLDIEFMVSILVFLTAIIFVSVSIINTIPKLSEETFSQDIKSKSFQMSSIVLFDQGHPANWNTFLLVDDTVVKRLGLSNGTKYYLDAGKVAVLKTYCDLPEKYEKVKDLLGLDFRNEIIINITDATSKIQELNCKPKVVSEIRPQATVTRIGIDSATNRIKLIAVSVL